MLVMLSEMRVMCGNRKNALYLFSVSVSTIALIACSISTIIASFAGALNKGIMTPPHVSYYVFLALGIFSAVRLLMLPYPKNASIAESTPTVTESDGEITSADTNENISDTDSDKE